MRETPPRHGAARIIQLVSHGQGPVFKSQDIPEHARHMSVIWTGWQWEWVMRTLLGMPLSLTLSSKK